jgi:hypothetical protein
MKINMWRLNNGKINITVTDDYDSFEFQLTKKEAKKLRKQLKKMILVI